MAFLKTRDTAEHDRPAQTAAKWNPRSVFHARRTCCLLGLYGYRLGRRGFRDTSEVIGRKIVAKSIALLYVTIPLVATVVGLTKRNEQSARMLQARDKWRGREALQSPQKPL